MTDTAKVFMSGRSQAVRLPLAYRVDTDEVFIRRDETTGDIILSVRPKDWTGFFALLEKAGSDTNFMADRDQGTQPDRDPFADLDD
ncbi:MAG: antitoxin [Alcanivoracaceae bacterium]